MATRTSSPRTGRPLVIVESPAKAKTISGFLGADFVVEASIGHVRDLVRKASELPEADRAKPWAYLGVDVDHDFAARYVVSADKKAHIAKLRSLLKEASELYLATDEDREGEAIAWHLEALLDPKKAGVPVKRMVFHEITRSAIQKAVAESRDIDLDVVDAQEGRRILDRLYGYDVSPVLWRKVARGTSAGRVQSVATRLVVERERERMRFRTAGWWDVVADLVKAGSSELFTATSVSVDGVRLATGKDFDELGVLRAPATVQVLDEQRARAIAGRLESSELRVTSVEEKPYTRSPSAPFITSTLQQEAGRKLRFSAQRTMSIAQRLYENGYITYMRTDSTTLSTTALDAARRQVRELYGEEYLPSAPRPYKNKKGAQEAHEAIRPAGESFRMPAEVEREVGPDEARLYELIWKRTIASQMNDARGTTASVRIGATTAVEEVELAASGRVITFPGFLRAYVEGSDDPEADLEDRETRLPQLAVGDRLDARELRAAGHSTQPPARYTEASLVKKLEDIGVGRPSTYASIISTIQNRGYVWKKGSALVPSFTAFAVVALLEQHFSKLVDYEFTKDMEEGLDRIAEGKEKRGPWLTRFYFGDEGSGGGNDGSGLGLKALVAQQLEVIDAAEINTIVLGTDPEGREVVVRAGKYGPYVKRGEDTASVSEEIAPDELTVERALELLAAPKGDRVVGTDPATGLTVFAKTGRFGPYVQLGDVESLAAIAAAAPPELDAKGKPKKVKKADLPKPRMSSLFKTMTVDTITLDEALQLLSLPRTVGADPESGEEIVAANGKFGPYLRKGTDSRSIGSEEQLLTITLDEALAIYSQPKQYGRGRSAPKPPLATFGDDPVSGKPIVMKEGRFGLYVTDGTTNASLRRGDDPETMSVERAQELLAERRIKDEADGKTTVRRGASPAKKAAKKAAPKKAAAKKAPTLTTRTIAAGTAKKAAAKKAAAKKAAPRKAAAKKAGGRD